MSILAILLSILVSMGITIPGFAQNVSGIRGYYVAPVPQYTDIIAYHNFEALGDLTKATGSATVTWTGGANWSVSSAQKLAGTNSVTCASYNNICSIPISGNINSTDGRIGIGVYIAEEGGQLEILRGDVSVNDAYGFMYTAQSAYGLYFYYRGSLSNSSTPTSDWVTLNAWNFFEIKMDGTTAEFYVNGILAKTITGASGTITSTSMKVITTENTNKTYYFDQFISSNDKNRDLYAIRTITNFS